MLLWSGVQLIVDVLGALVVTVIGHVAAWLSVLVFGLLGLFTGLMPEAPEVPELGSALSTLADANRYVPVSEFLLLLPVWGAIFLGATLYKAWKAIPLT
jgi:hypothetical protein